METDMVGTRCQPRVWRQQLPKRAGIGVLKLGEETRGKLTAWCWPLWQPSSHPGRHETRWMRDDVPFFPESTAEMKS